MLEYSAHSLRMPGRILTLSTTSTMKVDENTHRGMLAICFKPFQMANTSLINKMH